MSTASERIWQHSLSRNACEGAAVEEPLIACCTLLRSSKQKGKRKSGKGSRLDPNRAAAVAASISGDRYSDADKDDSAPANDPPPPSKQRKTGLKIKLGGNRAGRNTLAATTAANPADQGTDTADAGGSSRREWDSKCSTCRYGGALLNCDAPKCSVAMHAGCAGLTEDPIGGWLCPQHAVNGAGEEAPRKKKLRVVLGGRSRG